MPLIPSTYHPPPYLPHPHAQTILRALLPAPKIPPHTTESLDLPDGDFLELHWHLPHPTSAPLAILCHGLEGHAHASYMLHMVTALHATLCNALTWSYRGCGTRPNRLPRSYHSGATEDLASVVDHALTRTSGPLLLIGFSLGGNLILKYLSERSPPPRITAAAAISAPVDLASCADALDQKHGNALYRHRFLRTLTSKAATKAHLFPDQVPQLPPAALRSIRAFDNAYTAPLHGFTSAEDYYTRSSALPLLPNLTIPTLLLSALDDPLLAPPSFPTTLAKTHPHLHLETPTHGGHVAFLTHPLRSWLNLRIPAFLTHTPKVTNLSRNPTEKP
jgi:predicted alpha/beta-fold hydrolase